MKKIILICTLLVSSFAFAGQCPCPGPCCPKAKNINLTTYLHPVKLCQS